MAKNIKEVRETIGKDVKSNELSEGMVIQAANGGNPNKNLEERYI